MAELDLNAPADLEICAEELNDRYACDFVLRGVRLERAVRAAMEELPEALRPAARIATRGPVLNIKAIEALYRRPDFPKRRSGAQ